MTPTTEAPFRGRVVSTAGLPDGQLLIRLALPELARAVPGQYLYLQLPGGPQPLWLIEAHGGEGWLAGVLDGRRLPEGYAPPPGGTLECSRLQGEGFGELSGDKLVVLGQDEGVAAALFLAQRLGCGRARLVLLGTAGERLPFRPRPSRFVIPGMPPGTIAGNGVMEQAGIASRLAITGMEQPGCHHGTVAELLIAWWQSVPDWDRQGWALAAAGPWHWLEGLQQQRPAGLPLADCRLP
ncbi:hypothetical protein [Alkalilimnicola ehrlichii]|uniref:hypothetical protein n=1 Tax=Alkalilimnicola ehrlichii TaxID=351052 RepID=UPI003B9ECF0E